MFSDLKVSQQPEFTIKTTPLLRPLLLGTKWWS